MSNQETTARYLSATSGIDANKLTEGVLAESVWGPFVEALAGVKKGRIFLYGKSSLTPMKLRAKASQIKARFGLDLLIVDYLQLMLGGIKVQNREQEVSRISRKLKILAGDLNVPVLVAAQLNRAVENRNEMDIPALPQLPSKGGNVD
jgi:replicative DNA helicase